MTTRIEVAQEPFTGLDFLKLCCTRLKTAPFLILQFTPLLAFWTGLTTGDIVFGVLMYCFIIFMITAGYHRYFAHGTYTTSRGFQFFLALGGSLATQKGALWWAAHHRNHHKFSDKKYENGDEDSHSSERGFLWSHFGWILSEKSDRTKDENIPDLMIYPELVWLNKHYLMPTVTFGAFLLLVFGPSTLVAYLIAVVLGMHGTFTINSLSHYWGWQTYYTNDESRNNPLLALITFGEGWHNNHHAFQKSPSQGLEWWQLDISYLGLLVLDLFGLVEGVTQKIPTLDKKRAKREKFLRMKEGAT